MIGGTVTTQFDGIDETLWNCSLFEFPRNIQKYLPFLLSNTHKPVHIRGFMNVKCTREFLKQAILKQNQINDFLIKNRICIFRSSVARLLISLFYVESVNNYDADT